MAAWLWWSLSGGASFQEKGWLNQKEFLDGVALCQLVPGATVVQAAVALIAFRINLLMVVITAAGLPLLIF
jgi:chromate transport protein ChrA